MNERILHHYLDELRARIDVDPDEAETLFDALITSEDQSLLAETLSAWNDKGTTVDELFAFASIMRARMKSIDSGRSDVVDIVGTGGSQTKTFNVSTAAAFTIAGAAIPVAKHGNRAATSNSGSADVLSILGVDIDTDPDAAESDLHEHGICFMFAPRYHALSATLAAARRSLCRPTIFNNLGPLCNPASAAHQVIGVWDVDIMEKTAAALSRLGTTRSWIVHGENGLDEIALKGKTYVAQTENGKIDRFEITAADFGVYTLGNDLPSKCTAEESAATIREVLSGGLKDRDAERLVLINAAAAIFVAGRAKTLADAYAVAEGSIRSGAAAAKLALLAGQTK
jgi:anthranilate phosphoribosyltransferase